MQRMGNALSTMLRAWYHCFLILPEVLFVKTKTFGIDTGIASIFDRRVNQ